MSSLTCLIGKIKDGTVSEKHAQPLVDLVEQYTKTFEARLGKGSEVEADIRGGTRALEIYEEQFESKLRRSYNTVTRLEELDVKLQGAAANDIGRLSSRYFHEEFAAVKDAFSKRSMRKLADFLKVSDSSYFGKNSLNQTEQLDIVGAIYSKEGKSLSNPNSELFGRSIMGTLEEADKVAKDNGANLAKERGLGTQIVRQHLKKTTPEEFSQDVLRMADQDLLEDLAVKLPESINVAEALEFFLDGKRGSLAMSRLRKKVEGNPADFIDMMESHIQFSTASKWAEFHSKYGSGKVGDISLIGHVINKVEGRAVQSARLSHYGDGGQLLIDSAEDHMKKKGLSSDKIQGFKKSMTNGYEFSAGLIDAYSDPFFSIGVGPLVVRPKLIMDTISKLNPMLLGRVVLDAAIVDPANKVFASKAMGVKMRGGTTARLTKHAAEGFIGSLKNDRILAARLGLTIRSVSENISYQIRGLGESLTSEGMEKISSYFVRSTGLNAVTEAGRIAHILGASIDIGETLLAKTPFSDINPRLLEHLKRLDIKEADWKSMEKFISKNEGQDFLDLTKMWDSKSKKTQALGDKMARFFSDLEERGTPTSSPRISAFRARMNKAGPFSGMLAMSMTTFLGFPTSVINNHFKGMMNRATTLKGAAVLGSYALSLSSLGVIDQMSRDVAAGKEPVFDLNTIIKGMIRGGGLSLIGDFLLQGIEARSGYDFARGAASKTLGLPINTATELAGNILANLDDPQRMARDVTKQAARFAGTSHFLLGTLLNRSLVDRALLTIDPKYNKVFKRRIRKEEKRGGGFFLPPGK